MRGRLDQSGGVSLISMAIFMTIITVVILSYFYTALTNQKDSFTYDQSTRAYYAAEAGVQDAIRAINSDSSLRDNGKDNCPAYGGDNGVLGESDLNLQYTCQLINMGGGEIVGSTKDGTHVFAIQTDTSGGHENFLLVLRYSPLLEGVEREDGFLERIPRTAPEGCITRTHQFFPNNEGWQGSYTYPFAGGPTVSNKRFHALFRTTFIQVPSGNAANALGRTFFLNPASNTSCNNEHSSHVVVSFGGDQSRESVLQDTRCYSNMMTTEQIGSVFIEDFGRFSCQRTFLLNESMLNGTLFMRLSSIYDTSEFEVRLFECNMNLEETQCVKDAEKPLKNTQAIVDVTARSGNVFRRVQQRLPVGANYATDNLPDAAVMVGDGVCKNFEVGVDIEQFSAGCDPDYPDNYN